MNAQKGALRHVPGTSCSEVSSGPWERGRGSGHRCNPEGPLGRSSPSLVPTADWKEGVSDHIPYLFCKNRMCPEGEKEHVLGNRIWAWPEGEGAVLGPLHRTAQTGQLRSADMYFSQLWRLGRPRCRHWLNLVPGQPTSWFIDGHLWLCPHRVEGTRGLSGGLFNKGTRFIHEGSAANLLTSQRPRLLAHRTEVKLQPVQGRKRSLYSRGSIRRTRVGANNKNKDLELGTLPGAEAGACENRNVNRCLQ